MNNWRLLLLALVAVFQPITSLTERHLVDGRQQCCDRQTDTLLRDSRPFLYGTERLAKPSSPARRLNIRDETREDRQLRKGDTVSTRRSMERSWLDIREKGIRRSLSHLPQSNRVEYRSDRIADADNIERVIDLKRRNSVTGTRVSMQHYNVRTNELSSHNSLDREDNRISRPSHERQETDYFQTVNIHIIAENVVRQTPTRVIRENLRMKKEGFDHVSVSRDSRRHIARDRVSGLQRVTVTRDDVRRDMDNNNERREQERHAEQRRSQSDNSRIVQRVRNTQERLVESRQQNDNRRHIARERVSGLQRETITLDDVRRDVDNNNELREQERHAEQRRSMSDNSRIVQRTRNTQERLVESRQQNDDRRHITRERVSGLQRETITRDDVRRDFDNNNERREQERHAEQRRSLSDNSRIVQRVRNTQERLVESRQQNDDRRHIARERVSGLQRETINRDDVRRDVDNNNERREQERHAEQRRSLSDNSRIVQRVRNTQERLVESRLQNDARRHIARERVSGLQRETITRDEVRRDVDNNNERREQERHAKQRRSLSDNSRIVQRVRNTQERLVESHQQNDDRRHIARERVSGLQRETINRDDVRRDVDNNNERREQERHAEQRRSLSDNSRIVQRVRNTQERLVESRLQNDDRRHIARERVSGLQRETITRDEVRRDVDNNNERREQERHAEQRRSLSDSSRIVQRVRHTQERLVESRQQNDDRRHITRERVSGLQRETITRDAVKRAVDNNNERREQERHVEQRRSLSDNSRIVQRVRNTQERLVESRQQHDDRRHIAREHVSGLQRETITRDAVRRDVDNNNERREQELHVEQRRSLSDNSRIVQRVRNTQERLAESRQQNDGRTQSREEIKENSDRRVSRERIHMDRRDIRESRLQNDRNVRNGVVENRRDTRHNERQSRETRDNQFVWERRVESRASRRITERDNLVTDSKLSRSVQVLVVREDATREQIRTDRQRERDTADTIFRNVESARVHDIMISKIETKSEPITNWQYVFFTVQAAYLCGLAIQMLTPIRSEKSKSMNLRLWPSTQRLIKVD